MMLYGFSEPENIVPLAAGGCEKSNFLLVPAAQADCDSPEPGSLCKMYDDQGVIIDESKISCVTACPDGYVPALRRSGHYDQGQVRSCLRPEVLSQNKKQQPGGVRRLLTTVEIAVVGASAVAALGIIGWWIVD